MDPSSALWLQNYSLPAARINASLAGQRQRSQFTAFLCATFPHAEGHSRRKFD